MKIIKNSFLWVITAALSVAFSFELGLGESLVKIFIPLCVVSFFALVHKKLNIKYIEYPLFFFNIDYKLIWAYANTYRLSC